MNAIRRLGAISLLPTWRRTAYAFYVNGNSRAELTVQLPAGT